MQQEIQYCELDKDLYAQISGIAWSIQNMAGHGAEGRSTEYIGSVTAKDNVVFDFYKDTEGDYWYRTRKRLESGEIVSMDMYLFGFEPGKRYLKK